MLRRAEALLGALEPRPLSLETRVSGFRSHLPKPAIECLPDEILGIIIDLAISFPGYTAEIVNFSLVCLRFRTVILNMPSIWANVWLTVSMPTHFIETMTQRSGTRDLGAFISDRHRPHTLISDLYYDTGLSSARKDSLVALFSLSHRWAVVSIDIREDTAEFVRTSFPSPSFCSVHTFDFYCVNYACNFYQDWSMPNLRHLFIEGSIPLSPSRLWNGATMLVECDLIANIYPALKDITLFLASTPNLARLQLYLCGLRNSSPQSEIRIATLSKLRYLKFTSTRSVPGSIPRLLASISSPHLEEIYLRPHFSTEDERDEALSDYREVAQHMRVYYPSLRSFELVLGHIHYSGGIDDVKALIDVNILDDILWRLPTTITKITLKIAQLQLLSRQDGFYEDGDIHTMFYPNLKELNIEECSYIGYDSGSFYEVLADHLRRSGVTLDTFLPSRYPRNNSVSEDEAEVLMEEARAMMRMSGCWTG